MVGKVEPAGDPVVVYNMRVAGAHTFFVGRERWGFAVWVHNANGICPPEHHIATNKNWLSTARGGPWSPRFQKIFEKAGMTLEDAANKVRIPGHQGPHPEAYHQAIYDRLIAATSGLNGQAYKERLIQELEKIAIEASTPGSPLNKLLTK